ncbi:MAG: DUF2975 domain-containing protein [Chitinophagaceae bacterium]|nr:MAG: DUF2975 domain-containing protein [Chitinophagaceae bacterium]
MHIKSVYLRIALTILSWIIFIGVSIEAGGFLFNMFYFLFAGPEGPGFFYNHLELRPLFQYDKGHFIVMTGLMSLVAMLRATLFYVIIQMITRKDLSLSSPFNPLARKYIVINAWIAIVIGFFSKYGTDYATWLGTKGIGLPSVEQMRLGGADVWLFMGVTLFVIAQVFKRGIELQAEHDLTV